jgi:magnesium-transporting ATPase (P-type)
MTTNDKAKRKLKIVIAVLVFIVAFVFFYAIVGGQLKSLQQGASLLVGGLYLGTLFLLKDCKRTAIVWLIYIATALVPLGAFAVLWNFDVAKLLTVGLVLVTLSLTSRVWLRAI